MGEEPYNLQAAREFFDRIQTVSAYKTIVDTVDAGESIDKAVEAIDYMAEDEVYDLFESAVEEGYLSPTATGVTERGREAVEEYSDVILEELFEEKRVPGLPESLQPWNVGGTSTDTQDSAAVNRDASDEAYCTDDLDESLQKQKDEWQANRKGSYSLDE